MTKTYSRGALLVAALMVLAFTAQQAKAVTVPFPKFAHSYSVWFARAMDQCNPATVSVVSPNVPAFGCFQSNSTTDNLLTMNFGRLFISEHGRIGVFAAGLQFGGRVKLRLTLRNTRAGVSTKHPPGSHSVTFEDVTVVCPNTTFGFPVRSNGAMVGITSLAECLGPGFSGEQSPRANVEVLNAELLNADTGKVFAVPGIVR